VPWGVLAGEADLAATWEPNAGEIEDDWPFREPFLGRFWVEIPPEGAGNPIPGVLTCRVFFAIVRRFHKSRTTCVL
jgi:hypothetical protein